MNSVFKSRGYKRTITFKAEDRIYLSVGGQSMYFTTTINRLNEFIYVTLGLTYFFDLSSDGRQSRIFLF